MTTKIDRAEINRRNAAYSTGPRTAHGKARSVSTPSSTDAATGCRSSPARTPRLTRAASTPGSASSGPPTPSSTTWSSAAVHASWQLDRAERAEVARLVAESAREAARQTEKVARLGARLFRVPAGKIGTPPIRPGPRRRGDAPLLALRPATSRPPLPSGRRPGSHRHRLLLAAGPVGRPGGILDAGRTWQPMDRVRAIRLLGKQPLDSSPIRRCCRSTWPATPWTRRARTSSPSR